MINEFGEYRLGRLLSCLHINFLLVCQVKCLSGVHDWKEVLKLLCIIFSLVLGIHARVRCVLSLMLRMLL